MSVGGIALRSTRAYADTVLINIIDACIYRTGTTGVNKSIVLKYLNKEWHVFSYMLCKLMYNFNSLPSDDTIWYHGNLSTLVQVMAWCHQAPSHYLNQCWLSINMDQWHSPECNFSGTTPNINPSIEYDNSAPYIPGANELNIILGANSVFRENQR